MKPALPESTPVREAVNMKGIEMAGVRGGLGGWGGIAGEGREKLPREVQDPGSCCEGLTAQVSPDRSDASLPLTSV